MIKKFFSVISLSFIFISNSFSQSAGIEDGSYGYYSNVLDYSTPTSFGGSGRYAGIAGAATSLGGDIGTIHVNPAGLGMYRKSEFSFSPVIGYGGTNSSYQDPSNSLKNSYNQSDGKVIFGLSNIGLVISNAKDDLEKGDWRGGSFGISFSRTNSFQKQASFSAINQRNSIADAFAQSANGTTNNDFYNNQNADDGNAYSPQSLAYFGYVIDGYPSSNNQYHSTISDNTVKQDGNITTTGAQFSWNLAYGVNYKDKLYLGATLGIATLRYGQSFTLKETIGYYNNATKKFVSQGDTLNDFTYNRTKTSDGYGLDLKIGLLYKISDVIRIGTTVRTPTYYWLTEQTTYKLNTNNASNFNLQGISGVSYTSLINELSYHYISPIRITQGISLFANKNGFVSVDLEYVPYSMASVDWNFDPSGTSSASDNRTINNIYRSVINVRTGGELRLDIFRLRAGFAYMPSPLNSDYFDSRIIQISGGLGIQTNDFYFDLGVINTGNKSTFNPYLLNNGSNPSNISSNSQTNIVITGGIYF